jgi:hypothetical protein
MYRACIHGAPPGPHPISRVHLMCRRVAAFPAAGSVTATAARIPVVLTCLTGGGCGYLENVPLATIWDLPHR